MTRSYVRRPAKPRRLGPHHEAAYRTDEPPVERTCLKCRKPFMAETKYVRVCAQCKKSGAWGRG